MSRLERVTCDGRRCCETTTVSVAESEGWQLTPERDLCPRCARGRCAGTVGRRPSWMSPDQYDPCLCVLPSGHDGLCECKHDEPGLRSLVRDNKP